MQRPDDFLLLVERYAALAGTDQVLVAGVSADQLASNTADAFPFAV